MPQENLASRLARLHPLDRLSEEQRIILADRGEFRRLAAGKVVFEKGAQDTAHYYLLDGKVRLRAADGRETEVRSESETARRALSAKSLAQFDVFCHTDSVFLVLEPMLISTLLREAPTAGTGSQARDADSGPEADQDPAYATVMAFHEDLRNNRLVLPSLPDVAMRVRQASQKPDISLADLARVVEGDPALTVKLIHAANSPFYRGFRAIQTCEDAIVRLGLATTSELITVYTLREMFQSRNAALQARYTELWRHVSDVGAIACVLARRTPGLNPDKALLAGIVHDIGAVPVILYAEKHPERFRDNDLLETMICDLQAEIGSELLQSWNFPPDLVEAARHAEDWTYDSGEDKAQCVDAVLIAQAHEWTLQGVEGVPPLDSLPAYRKLAGGRLTPSQSLEVLDEARDDIEQLRGLLA